MADISPSRPTDFAWEAGETNRPLGAYRVCPCGVCKRYQNGVGYLSYSDAHGKGFTIWIQDERVFEMLEDALCNEGAHKLTLEAVFIEAAYSSSPRDEGRPAIGVEVAERKIS